MHPRRRLRLMLTGLAAFVAAVTVLNIGVNPYRAWPVSLIDAAYTRIPFSDEHLSTPYRMRNEQPTTVLLGTSRVLVGMEIEQGVRDGVFNAALAGARLDDLTALARGALQHRSVRRIIWGLDFILFNATWSGIDDPHLAARLAHAPLLMARETIFSLDAVAASGRLLLRLAAGRSRLSPARLFSVPWDESVIRTELEALAAHPPPIDRAVLAAQSELWRATYAGYQRSAAQWTLFAQLIDEVRGHGVELILFIPPFSRYELDAMREREQWPAFREWKRELAQLAPFHDFSGYTPIAARDELYTMPVFSHFRPAVGHTILRHLLGHACDGCGEVARAILASGVLVDANNVDARLRQQDLALPPLVRPVGLLDEKRIQNRKRQTGNSTLASPPCPAQVPVSISCFPFPVCHPPREAT